MARRRRSPYEVLEVAATASPEEIRAAYRRLAKKHHPDHQGDAAAFRAVKAAYDVLSDPDRRARYDARSAGQRGAQAGAAQGAADSYPKAAAKEAGAAVIDHALAQGQSLVKSLLEFGFTRLRHKILGPR